MTDGLTVREIWFLVVVIAMMLGFIAIAAYARHLERLTKMQERIVELQEKQVESLESWSNMVQRNNRSLRKWLNDIFEGDDIQLDDARIDISDTEEGDGEEVEDDMEV